MAKIDYQKITPYLWFDNNAKEAATYYCSIFKNSRILSESELIVEFELEGMRFMALNGGPKYTFSEATSFFITCFDQDEVDHFWNAFTKDGGEESMCGWCKDKYGLSWQVVPRRFMEMMESGNEEQKKRVINAMMPMRKLILKEFEAAYTPG